MFNLFKRKNKEAEPSNKSAVNSIADLRNNQKIIAEKVLKGEKPTEEEMNNWRKAHERVEEEKRKKEEEVLAEFGLTYDTIEEVKKDAYNRNLKDGVYHCDPKAKYGSVDNPRVVGMENCTTLFFKGELGGWCLTDGLGNGWIR